MRLRGASCATWPNYSDGKSNDDGWRCIPQLFKAVFESGRTLSLTGDTHTAARQPAGRRAGGFRLPKRKRGTSPTHGKSAGDLTYPRCHTENLPPHVTGRGEAPGPTYWGTNRPAHDKSAGIPVPGPGRSITSGPEAYHPPGRVTLTCDDFMAECLPNACRTPAEHGDLGTAENSRWTLRPVAFVSRTSRTGRLSSISIYGHGGQVATSFLSPFCQLRPHHASKHPPGSFDLDAGRLPREQLPTHRRGEPQLGGVSFQPHGHRLLPSPKSQR